MTTANSRIILINLCTCELFIFKISSNALFTFKIRSHHTHPFNGPLSGTTQESQYQKGKKPIWILLKQETVGGSGISSTIMQVCTSLQTDNHTSTPPLLCFLQAGCPSCHPTNSVKALKAKSVHIIQKLSNVHSPAYYLTCSNEEKRY